MKTIHIILGLLVLGALYYFFSKKEKTEKVIKSITFGDIIENDVIPRDKPEDSVFDGVLTNSAKAETKSKASSIATMEETMSPKAPAIITSYHEPDARRKVTEPVLMGGFDKVTRDELISTVTRMIHGQRIQPSEPVLMASLFADFIKSKVPAINTGSSINPINPVLMSGLFADFIKTKVPIISGTSTKPIDPVLMGGLFANLTKTQAPSIITGSRIKPIAPILMGDFVANLPKTKMFLPVLK